MGLWGGCREIVVVILGGSGHGDGSEIERLLLFLLQMVVENNRKSRIENRFRIKRCGEGKEKNRTVGGWDRLLKC